jgi:hypothetical protein
MEKGKGRKKKSETGSRKFKEIRDNNIPSAKKELVAKAPI